MGSVSQIVTVSISQQTQSVQQASFSIPAIEGSSGRFAATLTTMGTTTSASNQLTALSSVVGIAKGQRVVGTGIPANTYVTNIVGTTVSMSNNATASATVSVAFTDYARAYSSLAGMKADGFLTSDAEYVHAQELLEQDLQPTSFVVIEGSAAVVQVDTITPTAVNNAHYIVTIDLVPYDYTADSSATVSEIVTGLIALINADSAVKCVASGSTTLILTGKNAGGGFTTTVNANQVLVHTTANHSIADDIAASQIQNNSWYGLTICSQVAADIEQVAAYIETQLKVFGADSNDADILTSSTADVASVLKGDSYKRTFILYSGTPNDGAAAAWLGGQLPQVPGSNNWKFVTLTGITADTFTDNQRIICIGTEGQGGKNCNIYETIGGVPITEEGFMAGGQFIDLTVGIDWLVSTIQTNVFTALVNSRKIPYTNLGIAVIENAIRQSILQGIQNGLIDGNSPFTVTAPDVLSIPVSARQNRILPGVAFTCRLAGALNFVEIQGVVTV